MTTKKEMCYHMNVEFTGEFFHFCKDCEKLLVVMEEEWYVKYRNAYHLQEIRAGRIKDE